MIIGIDLYSHHFQHAERYENETPGIYASAHADFLGDCRPTLGVYRNSIRDISIHGGCTFGRHFRVYVGAVSGYGAKLVPLVVSSYIFRVVNDVNFSVSFIPYVPATRSNVAHFSIEREF